MGAKLNGESLRRNNIFHSLQYLPPIDQITKGKIITLPEETQQTPS